MVDLIVRSGTVITVDPMRRVISDGAVAVEAGAIVDVGPGADIEDRFEAARVIRRPRSVMMPGLVDAHSHAGHGLVRTMADDLDLWMDACSKLYLHGATPGFWFAEGRLTAAERLLAGTTTSLSMLGGAGDTIRADDPSHALAHVRAYVDTGLRTMVAVGPGAPPFPKATTNYSDGSGPRTVQSSLEDQLATVAAVHAGVAAMPLASVATTFTTLTVDDVSDRSVFGTAGELHSLAIDLDLRIVQDGHRSDTVRASAELGLLTERLLLSHATDLDAAEIALIAKAGASVAHNPSAIFSQYGRCPVPELMEAGVIVGLGSDATAPDRSADMFRHMFQLTRYHRAMRQDPELFPPGMAIEMATLGAANTLGMGELIGSLEVGKRADIVLVDTDQPHLTPFTHPTHQIVYFATGADVEAVVVDGEVLMEGRTPRDLDLEELLSSARLEQTTAFSRAGIERVAERPGTWGSVRYGDAIS